MEGTTLSGLPKQPLPAMRNATAAGPSFITIWMVGCLAFFLMLHQPLSRKKLVSPGFRYIWVASLLLTVSYFLTTVDRWLHYMRNPVSFSYVLIYPFIDIFSVSSSVLLLWGTFQITWVELVNRVDLKRQGKWWRVAAQCAIFIVSLVSMYYLTLLFALAIVWVRFVSLNTIADIATKRTHFEIAKGSMNFAFCAMVLGASSLTFLARAKRKEGKYPISRILTAWLATLFIFLRSFIELILILMVYDPRVTRADLGLTRDIYYGLLTVLYLLLIYSMTKVISRPYDPSSPQARLIEGLLRRHVLEKLASETNNGFDQAPRFDLILEHVGKDLRELFKQFDSQPHPPTSSEEKEGYANDYIRELGRQFGKLDPKAIAREVEAVNSRNQSRTASRTTNRSGPRSNERLRRSKRPSTSTMGSTKSGDSRPPLTKLPVGLQPPARRVVSAPTMSRDPSLSISLRSGLNSESNIHSAANDGRRYFSEGSNRPRPQHYQDGDGSSNIFPNNPPTFPTIPEGQAIYNPAASRSKPPDRPQPALGRSDWYVAGRHTISDTSSLPSHIGSPVSSAATMFYQAGNNDGERAGGRGGAPRYFAGQRAWETGSQVGEHEQVERGPEGLIRPAIPLTQQGPRESFAERRRRERRM
ncbi:hypothetical protein PG991_013323 [Apiospora marii]|uniref:Uncharacterized protein n=1 Tax=Apiospora marii TaxID=335849 RepID=A0ABR1R5P7_9PEZI